MIFKPVFDAWGNIALLARDLGQKYPTVMNWKNRDSIPAAFHSDIADKAHERGLKHITIDLLAQLSKQRRQKS